jgi:hypothetical protein
MLRVVLILLVACTWAPAQTAGNTAAQHQQGVELYKQQKYAQPKQSNPDRLRIPNLHC